MRRFPTIIKGNRMKNSVKNSLSDGAKVRLLFVIPSFAIGGITSSLRSLLLALDYSKLDVEIFCREKVGPLKNAFPQARTLPENIWLSSLIKDGNLFQKALFYLFKCIRVGLRIIGVDMNIVYGRIGGRQLKTYQYDAVISFHEGLSPIVCYYPAKKRIAWIHSDYRRYFDMVKKDEGKQYQLYDQIVCVSEFARSVFLDTYPFLAEKTIAIHNIIPIEEIKLKSKASTGIDERFTTSVFTIVSVGRLDPVKQFDRIPSIAAEVKLLTNIPFRWYIIGGERGFGDVDSFILNDINEYNVEREVILLGEKENVYPYIRQADLYVCTSVSESFPLAVNEAKALGVPIVSNAFPSVRESITEGLDGYIVSLQNMAIVITEVMKGNRVFPGSTIDNNTPLLQFYKLVNIDL